MDIEFEIRELKRRVGDLEGAVNVLAGRIKPLEPVFEALRSECNQRFDGVDHLMRQLVDRIDTLNTQTWSLRDDLPALVADAVSRLHRDGGRHH